jgi:hypothetical protein
MKTFTNAEYPNNQTENEKESPQIMKILIGKNGTIAFNKMLVF